ncbi:MAG TPA: HD-GYP domain-containing protein [Bacilli bacterium]|nr:HD-GYP domain-containing protein [Bacilli bacterium]
MRLILTSSVRDGETLAKAIYNDNGQVLVNEGVTLTPLLINRLVEMGISYIYIHDELTEDIEVRDIISEKTRQESIHLIRNEFQLIANNAKLGKVFHNDHLSKNFSTMIRNILDEIQNNSDVLTTLSELLLHDSYIFTHSLNVAIYSLGLGLQLNYSEQKLIEIGLGAILHDVGKLMIPLEILDKPGKLTKEEYEIMKSHTVTGFQYLKDLPNISLMTAHCALSHHERIDGSGYPRGIKGKDIHPYAQIIGVCDVFDALTSQRVYKKAMLPHEALEILYVGAGKLFDKELIEAFRNTIALYPIGLTVTLSDGREAIVIKQNKQLTTRPVVRVISENGEQVTPYEVNLETTINVTIVECETMLSDSSRMSI